MEALPDIDSYEPQVVLLSKRLCWVRAGNWFGPKYISLSTNRDYKKEPPNKDGRLLPPEKGGNFEITIRSSKSSSMPIAVQPVKSSSRMRQHPMNKDPWIMLKEYSSQIVSSVVSPIGILRSKS